MITATVATSFIIGSIILLRGFMDGSSVFSFLIAFMIMVLVGMEMVVLGLAWDQYSSPDPCERSLERIEDGLGNADIDLNNPPEDQTDIELLPKNRRRENSPSIDMVGVHGGMGGVGLGEAGNVLPQPRRMEFITAKDKHLQIQG
ncbi:MAG: hypothetical protein Q9208_006463 [Pyrenodesmia sp. 3 TL-2023]